MQNKVRNVAQYWNISEETQFLRFVETTLQSPYAPFEMHRMQGRRFWNSTKVEVSLLFLLDLVRVFNLTRLSDLTDFDNAPAQSPIFLDRQPHFALQNRARDCMKAAGISENKLREEKFISHATLRRLERPIDQSPNFYLNSLDGFEKALRITSIDQLFALKVVTEPPVPVENGYFKLVPTAKVIAYENIVLSA